jgi:hypothetical protein
MPLGPRLQRPCYSGRSIVYYSFALKCPVPLDDASYFIYIIVRLLANDSLQLVQNSGIIPAQFQL